MSLREGLNARPVLTYSVAGGIILAAALITIFESGFRDNSQIPGPISEGKSFYTDDLGKTFFTDAAGLVVPFEHDGKQAVAAVVVRCGDGPPEVQYIARYRRDALAEIEKLKAEKPPNLEGQLSRLSQEGMEVASPGGQRWVTTASPAASTIMAGKKCPDGKVPIEIMP